MEKIIALLKNIISGPVASLLGGLTLLCQNGNIAEAFPVIVPYCGIIAGIALLFAKFK